MAHHSAGGSAKSELCLSSSLSESILCGGGGGGCATSSVDPRAARKEKKKAERLERKEQRTKNQKIAKLYTPEERTAYAKKKEAEARLAGSLRKKASIEQIKKSLKEPTVSYDTLTGPYSKNPDLKILLELCSKHIVSTSTTSEKSVGASVGGAGSAEASAGGGGGAGSVEASAGGGGEAGSKSVVSKLHFSPKWIELLEMVKYILPPSKTSAYRKQLLKDGSQKVKVKRIIEPSMTTWLSVQLFFALHKLTLKFIAKKPMKLKHVEGATRCITSINHMIKTNIDFSPRLQQFFNLLGVPPTILISRAHIPVAKAFIGIADRSPIEASLFPTEKPFDGKLEEECGICFQLDTEPAKRLSCKHTFHTVCHDLWYVKSKTCATCRNAC